MKTFFTADTHFAHEGVLAMSNRPFKSIDEHDDALIDNINTTVGTNDRLFILGDFAWRAEESYFSRIKCKNVHLIIGNHDKPSKVTKLFKTVEQTALVKACGHKVFLSHYPHAYWPSSHYGSLHLYGHIHGQREETLDSMFPDRRAMDCGVDVAAKITGQYRPFSEDEIVEILMVRPGHDPVEWYRQNENRS